MNVQEAIKILKEDRYLYESDIVSAGDGSPDGDLLLAIDIAIAALEKQIPQRVTLGDDEQDDICCPSCGFGMAVVDDYGYESVFYKYCPSCSQKLKWSDTK